jgi:hypothetical protein
LLLLPLPASLSGVVGTGSGFALVLPETIGLAGGGVVEVGQGCGVVVPPPGGPVITDVDDVADRVMIGVLSTTMRVVVVFVYSGGG